MPSVVQMWGNSAAVRLPSHVLKEAKLAPGEQVAITAEQGRIVIAPLRSEFRLDELLARITPKNRHETVDFGGPRGREVI